MFTTETFGKHLKMTFFKHLTKIHQINVCFKHLLNVWDERLPNVWEQFVNIVTKHDIMFYLTIVDSPFNRRQSYHLDLQYLKIYWTNSNGSVFVLFDNFPQGLQCRQRHGCYPSKRRWLMFLVPGVLLAGLGLIIFAFLERESNYQFTHSSWHVCMALAILFIMPPRRVNKSGTLSIFAAHANDLADLDDINDFYTGDSARLISDAVSYDNVLSSSYQPQLNVIV